jgi:tripartite ATP-independent transporter DctM subunit
VYLFTVARVTPDRAPAVASKEKFDLVEIVTSLVSPLVLIFAVLGSILTVIATPTEAAAVGAMGAILLALLARSMTMKAALEVARSTTRTTAMVFFILIGASVFSLVFRGYGGDALIQRLFEQMPGGLVGATFVVMLVIFLLGFILDFIEITFVVVPIVGPVLLAMGLDPIWLGVMIAINLQTSFLTPPFGFALFYLRGVAPDSIKTTDIYRGVIPFIVMQLLMMLLLIFLPELATWLPQLIFSRG